MAEIEKIAADRYRIRSHGQLITLSAQDMKDVFDYGLLHMNAIEQEARQAAPERYNREMDERNRINAANREKPWLPLHDGE